MNAAPDAVSVAVAADQGKIYLLYRDQTTARGTVLAYNGSWTGVPLNEGQAGITGQFNVSSLVLRAQYNLLYAAAIEGGSVNSYIYR